MFSLMLLSGRMLLMGIEKKLITTLKKRKLTLAAAESCSGGYLSYLLTKTPGSSKVFKGGLITYSLEAKNKFFRIPSLLLRKTDGVSKEIASALAERVKKLFTTDLGVSIVGFAGPKTKKGIKKGTVFVGIADKKNILVLEAIIKGNRDTVRKKVSQLLLSLLYKKVTQ